MDDDKGASGDFVPPPNSPFQIDELPSPALRHLFKFLNWEDQKCMRKLCKGMRYFIEYEYGIHVQLPARHSEFYIKSGIEPLTTISWKRVTDKMITEAIQGLEGKLIRSLKMDEMNPVLNPSPFQKLIHYPWLLLRVSLKYVDVDFLVGLLTSCRNLTEFRYGTRVERNLAAEDIQPPAIPREGEQLIEFITQLPPPTFQVDKLSSLDLRFREVIPDRHSDWGNVAFILISLSQRILWSLKNFSFDVGHCLILKERLQLLACIGQFLAQCPNLVKLEFSTLTWWTPWSESDRDWSQPRFEDPPGTTLPQNVVACFIQKYGSALLKQVQVQGAEPLESEQRMLVPINQIMRNAGRALKNLQKVRLGFHFQLEHELFQHFLSALSSPSIKDFKICDETEVSFTAGTYDLLLGQIHSQSNPPFYGYLEKLCISREVEHWNDPPEEDEDATGGGGFSLPRLLNRMRALKHFQFVPRTPDHDGYLEEDEEFEEHEGAYDYLVEERDDFVISDVTFEHIGDVHFQQLQVLILEGIKISTEAAARLIRLRNLTELILHVLPEHRHQQFGIHSGDLLRLMGRLRKLDKLLVSMILFPEEDDLKSTHFAALDGIGILKQMRRVVDNEGEFIGERFLYNTEPMIQYKFALGYPNDVWTWRMEFRR